MSEQVRPADLRKGDLIWHHMAHWAVRGVWHDRYGTYTDVLLESTRVPGCVVEEQYRSHQIIKRSERGEG
jgi:hypothetical protein